MRRSIRPPHDWRAYCRLLQVMRDARPALVHTHSSKAGVLGRRAAFRLGIPALHTPHAFSFLMPLSPARRGLYVRIERAAARWCRYVICVSEAERQAALAVDLCPPEKLAVIRNGVDVRLSRTCPGGRTGGRLGLGRRRSCCWPSGDCGRRRTTRRCCRPWRRRGGPARGCAA